MWVELGFLISLSDCFSKKVVSPCNKKLLALYFLKFYVIYFMVNFKYFEKLLYSLQNTVKLYFLTFTSYFHKSCTTLILRVMCEHINLLHTCDHVFFIKKLVSAFQLTSMTCIIHIQVHK